MAADPPPDPTTNEFPKVERRGHGSGLYTDDRHPRQRNSDRGWRYWVPWVYKHLMPAVAIIVAAVAVGYSADASSTAESNAAAAKRASFDNRKTLIAIQSSRRSAIMESCNQDEAIADVLRKALLGFGVGTPGNPAPPGVVAAFRPLGGLKPLSKKEQRARCLERVKRGGP